LEEKYVIFKDDDAGKDFPRLKKWVDVVLSNDAKGAIGLIGKYIKDPALSDYINSLDPAKIEIFCHGYSHSYVPFILRRFIGRNRILPLEFDRDIDSHNGSLKRYSTLESKYLNTKAISFGPPGNEWNNSVVDALVNNDFKIMFSWSKLSGNIFTIPLSGNLKQNSIEEFTKDYEKNKEDPIFTLQFHHADLTNEQFDLIAEVIDYLKKDEKRIFVTPSELLGISQENDEIMSVMTTMKK